MKSHCEETFFLYEESFKTQRSMDTSMPQDNIMSMYSHIQTHEHKRHTEDAFKAFVVVHSEHLCSIVVELVMQLVLIGTVIGGVAFLATLYARAVLHLTSMMWMAVQDEPG